MVSDGVNLKCHNLSHMATFVTRELTNSAQSGLIPPTQSTQEFFFLGGFGSWYSDDPAKQIRLTRTELVDLQAKITAILAVVP